MPRHSLINAAVILCLTGSTALGHPGHGTAGDGSTPQHYLTEPAHIAQWIVVIAASMAIGWFAAKWKADRDQNGIATVKHLSENH